MVTEFLIVCPLVFLAGFVDAIGGGGGLISLPAYLMAGIPAHFAVGTNKLSSAMGTTVATLEFARSGYIRLKLAFLSVLAAIVGVVVWRQHGFTYFGILFPINFINCAAVNSIISATKQACVEFQAGGFSEINGVTVCSHPINFCFIRRMGWLLWPGYRHFFDSNLGRDCPFAD